MQHNPVAPLIARLNVQSWRFLARPIGIVGRVDAGMPISFWCRQQRLEI